MTEITSIEIEKKWMVYFRHRISKSGIEQRVQGSIWETTIAQQNLWQENGEEEGQLPTISLI